MFAISLMELMEQEAEGLGLDAATFCAFYDDALPRVYGYFLHRTGRSPAVAEDLTQETFLAAVRELKKGRRPEAPIPWIYGIARHKLLDHYRRRERTERLAAPRPKQSSTSSPSTPGPTPAASGSSPLSTRCPHLSGRHSSSTTWTGSRCVRSRICSARPRRPSSRSLAEAARA